MGYKQAARILYGLNVTQLKSPARSAARTVQKKQFIMKQYNGGKKYDYNTNRRRRIIQYAY